MAEEREKGGSVGRDLLWTALILEHEGVQTPIHMQLWLDAEAPGGSSASVVFVGSDVPSVRAQGDTPLDVLKAAVREADAKLNQLRASGWRILHHMQGYGVVPFDTALEEHFSFVLGDFGPKPDAEIISGPTPSDSGDVVFVVRVEDRTATVLISIDGIGCRDGDDMDDWNVASRLVSAYVDERPSEKLEWCKQASRLRRAAGNPRPHDFPRLPHITVAGEPIAGKYFVELVIAGVGVGHRVLFSRRGGVMDECDHWPSLSEPDRNAAFATAVDYALANPEKMAAAGLDMDLLKELYA